MKVTQIEKLNQLISRTDMTGNQKVEWLTNFIDEHVTEQLRLHNVVGRSEQLFCCDCKHFKAITYHDKMYCRDCMQKDRFTAK